MNARQFPRARFDRHICTRMLAIAGPLILSMTGSLVMQMADTLFLAWYSSDALAAVGPAGITCWVYGSLFLGMAGYATPLVAQCVGRGRDRQVGEILWQGIHLALLCGGLLLAFSPWVATIFDWLDHPAPIRAMEIRYFQILCVGIVPALLAAALGGFYGGRGDTRPLMAVQLLGVALNGLLDYALIFGRWGLPRWGIAGAAWATVAAQTFNAAALAALVLRRRWRDRYGTSQARIRPRTLRLYLRFGLPSGLRMTTEAAAWMMFVFFVGQVGAPELAATNIAHRLNMLAFFPVWGVAEAVRTMVAQSQGRGHPDESTRVVWHGLLVTQCWMLGMAALYVLAPRALFEVFAPRGAAAGSVTDFAAIASIGVVLLRYVAAYCLLDAFNAVLSMALQAAGDTQWSMRMSMSAHTLLITALWIGDRWRRSIHVPWAIATVFVMALALIWLWRFRKGAWRSIEVLDASGHPSPGVPVPESSTLSSAGHGR